MTNPETNFFADESLMTAEELAQYKYDRSFHLATWTVDTVTDFPEIIENNYAQDDIDAMVAKIKNWVDAGTDTPVTEKYLYSIDTYEENDTMP